MKQKINKVKSSQIGQVKSSQIQSGPVSCKAGVLRGPGTDISENYQTNTFAIHTQNKKLELSM